MKDEERLKSEGESEAFRYNRKVRYIALSG